MLILTTPTIEGKKIIEYHGLVTGDSLLGANLYKDMFSGVRDVVGGRTSKYEEELTNARELALKSMEEEAERKGLRMASVISSIGRAAVPAAGGNHR